MEQNGEIGIVDIVGPKPINHYVCALRQQLDIQRSQNKITIQKLYLMIDTMKDLFTLVAKRKEKVLKEFVKEQVDGSFQQLKLLAKVPNTEIKMWESHNNTRFYGTATLRDRSQFLLTLSAIMRSDSVYNIDLYYMCVFKFLLPKDQDPYHIIIIRHGDGKGSNEQNLLR